MFTQASQKRQMSDKGFTTPWCRGRELKVTT